VVCSPSAPPWWREHVIISPLDRHLARQRDRPVGDALRRRHGPAERSVT
jgi:hypothetical protein